ncbi:MAG: NigD-like protein [Paludibacter sp.]
MKALFEILFLSLIIPLFVACDVDDDNCYVVNNYYEDIATVKNPDSLSTFFFRLDNNKLMWAAATNLYNYRPKDGQRIVAYYSVLSDKRATSLYDYDVRLNNVYTVLTKGIFKISPSTQDSIGNDSISISEIWIGSDYLNVEFRYLGSNQIHYINLVSDASKVYTDGKVHLEFRHNANGDTPNYYRQGIVSFDLKSLQASTSNKSLNLIIHVNVPNQVAEKTYSLTYNFDSNSTLIKSPKISFPEENRTRIN